MSECTVLGLREQLENGEIHLVDVREKMEFAGGRVSGASLIPLGELEKRHKELDHSKPIYVMCRTGRRSSEAQRKLQALGFTNVVNVSGGIEAWKKESLPLEKDEYAPWSIERQVRFTAGLLVLTGVLLSLFVHPYFIAIPGFIGFGLAFTATIDWCGMGLLIAKMPWNKRVA
ncbi:rhodanese-like domain-containing protein [Leptolyngbya sp. 7M]|uniref:rhodanese-like domain-containing protein n=1 Tax=Leptolyngbya sp. 7M TaxID=2812896 RepID=UPI001B8D9970|nr:rhodanese-like domain-containing protein [Leptolyngbya sp. 7M]QYO65337.1 rhodanese-like domain-containing protein [Leptolyngbya sp. 7M]